MTIFYGGTEEQVKIQLDCIHDWQGACIDNVSRYYKCTLCYCLKRDCSEVEYYNTIQVPPHRCLRCDLLLHDEAGLPVEEEKDQIVIFWTGMEEYEKFDGTYEEVFNYVYRNNRWDNYGNTGAEIVRARKLGQIRKGTWEGR